jgi:hypothetical protein
MEEPNQTVPDTVEIKREKLDELLKRLDRLESAADKAHLANYDAKNKGEKQTIIRIKTIDGKAITQWKVFKNQVEKNPNGVWVEDQQIEVFYEDGTTEVMPYVFFSRRYKHIPGVLVSEILNKKLADVEAYGERFYELEADGKVYKIGSKFVN